MREASKTAVRRWPGTSGSWPGRWSGPRSTGCSTPRRCGAFIAAFGSTVNPIELFAAYGIANVAGALPLTPGGLGVVDSAAPLLLVGFGVTRSVATLGVLAWRLVNFWLPIPVGALSYVSLKVKPGQGRAAMESAISGMLAVVGARSPYDTPRDAAREPRDPGADPSGEAEEDQDRRAG